MSIRPIDASVVATDLAQQMALKSSQQTQASQVALNNSQAVQPDLKVENVAPAQQVLSDAKPTAVPLIDAVQRLVGVNPKEN